MLKWKIESVSENSKKKKKMAAEIRCKNKRLSRESTDWKQRGQWFVYFVFKILFRVVKKKKKTLLSATVGWQCIQPRVYIQV